MSIEKTEDGKFYFSVIEGYEEYICKNISGQLFLYKNDKKAHNGLEGIVSIDNEFLYESNDKTKENCKKNLEYYKENSEKISNAYSEATLKTESKENSYKAEWFNSFDKEPKSFIKLVKKEIKRLNKMKKGKNRRIKKLTKEEIKAISDQITTDYLLSKNEYHQKEHYLYVKKEYGMQQITEVDKQELSKLEKKYNEQKEIFQKHHEAVFSKRTSIIAIVVSIISLAANIFSPAIKDFINSKKDKTSSVNTELVNNVVSAINILDQENIERIENINDYVDDKNDAIQKETKDEVLQIIDSKEKELEKRLDDKYVKIGTVELKQ